MLVNDSQDVALRLGAGSWQSLKCREKFQKVVAMQVEATRVRLHQSLQSELCPEPAF